MAGCYAVVIVATAGVDVVEIAVAAGARRDGVSRRSLYSAGP